MKQHMMFSPLRCDKGRTEYGYLFLSNCKSPTVLKKDSQLPVTDATEKHIHRVTNVQKVLIVTLIGYHIVCMNEVMLCSLG